IVEAQIELAQHVYAAASAPAAQQQAKKLDRMTLLERAWRKFETTLTAFPRNADADQAAFAAANTLLDRKHYAEAGQAAAAYARRYPASNLLDSFWYVQGYCDFAVGKHLSAIEMCRKVANTKRLDKATG